MTTSTRWWFGAFVVAVFLAGTSVGVIVDRLWLLRGGPSRVQPAPAVANRVPRVVDIDRMVEVNVVRLRRHFGFTASQESSVRPLLEAWAKSITGLQTTTREQLRTETVRFEAELSVLLTPEQRNRLATARSVLVLPAPEIGGRFEGPRRGGPGRGGPGFGPGGPTGRGRE